MQLIRIAAMRRERVVLELVSLSLPAVDRAVLERALVRLVAAIDAPAELDKLPLLEPVPVPVTATEEEPETATEEEPEPAGADR